MKLRKPEGVAPPAGKAEVFTKSFDVELITPIYGGGVRAGEPDTEMPIRSATIRGQLRFWWRLLNRGKYPNSRDLFRAERAIFGGLANEGGATASRVRVWVTDVKMGDAAPCATYETVNGQLRGPNWHGLPGYALFPGQGKLNRQRTDFEPGKDPANILRPPASFCLHVDVRGDNVSATDCWEQQVKPALRWWASFGGIGARTRRGVGSVKVAGLAPVSETEVGGIGCHLVCRREERQAQNAWIQAIDKLKGFRQGPGTGRNGTTPQNPGRSRWPEADSIRGITGCHLDQPALPAQNGKPAIPAKTHAPVHPAMISFPRAAFGLPIITHFKPGIRPTTRDPDDTALYPMVGGTKQDRMASPLILKPMWTGTGFAPIALLLPYDHVGLMDLRLEINPGASNPSLPRDLPAGTWWPTATASTMTGSTSPNPLKGRSGDVLADFLAFFMEH
jgi:CRISPR-associated protein Cmr1